MKQQNYSMTVGNSQKPESFINLTSRFGQHSVCFSVNSDGQTNEFTVESNEDLDRIIGFLLQRRNAEENLSKSTPIYKPTGVGLCMMDHTGKVLDTYYGQSGKGIDGFVQSWDYELLQQLFPFPNAVYAFFELYDGSIGRNVLIKIIQTCISLQARFVATGDPKLCNKMMLQHVADLAGYDITIVSRATQNVRIVTKNKTFTLNNNVTNLEEPSLFDAGCTHFGLTVSRLEVVDTIKKMIDQEDPSNPMSDLAITQELQTMGYQVERRTVDKYRSDILGIPNFNQRRRK